MNVINKIKEYGFWTSVEKIPIFIRLMIIKLYNKFYFFWYKKLPIDEHSIVLESEGDCCDNAYALFDYMKSNGYVEKYKITWLVEHPENYRSENMVQYKQKLIGDHFAKETIKELRTFKWYFYDHCNVMSEFEKRKSQTIIYLGHGLRNKKSDHKIEIKADFIITTGLKSKLAHRYLDHFFEENILTLGYPRLDYFKSTNNQEKQKIIKIYGYDSYGKILLWMPTFRQSANKEISLDYTNCETGITCVPKWENMKFLNDELNKADILLILKVHHLQKELDIYKKHYSNINFISDNEIKQKGLQLYQFVTIADALITDYSSIFVDYLLLDKPMIFTLDDLEQYEDNRGLWPDDYVNCLPGYHTYSVDELIRSIKEISDGEDIYRDDRRKMLLQYHSYVDGYSSRRIVNYFNL